MVKPQMFKFNLVRILTRGVSSDSPGQGKPKSFTLPQRKIQSFTILKLDNILDSPWVQQIIPKPIKCKFLLKYTILANMICLFIIFSSILLYSTLCVVPSGCDMPAWPPGVNVCERVFLDHFIFEARLWRYFDDFAAQDRNILSLMLKNLIWICMSGKRNGGGGRLCVLKEGKEENRPRYYF